MTGILASRGQQYRKWDIEGVSGVPKNLDSFSVHFSDCRVICRRPCIRLYIIWHPISISIIRRSLSQKILEVEAVQVSGQGHNPVLLCCSGSADGVGWRFVHFVPGSQQGGYLPLCVVLLSQNRIFGQSNFFGTKSSVFVTFNIPLPIIMITIEFAMAVPAMTTIRIHCYRQ